MTTGGGGVKLTPKDFQTLKFKISANQNETISTCSPIMNTSFDVNWMLSFIPYILVYKSNPIFEAKNTTFLEKV